MRSEAIAREIGVKQRLADFADLAKPRIMLLALITVLASMSVAAAGAWPSAVTVAGTLVGVAFAVAAGGALNCFIERHADARMCRTAKRPLPSGRMRPWHALLFGTILWIASYFVLFFLVNPLTAYLTMLAFGAYVGVYTPMKRLSAWSTFVGAVPGALPPLIGWTAARGEIETAGFILFAILFVWQIPHFMSLAILRRDEYAQAGMPMMPVVKGPKKTLHAMTLFTIILIPLSLLPAGFLEAGVLYRTVAAILGAGFLMLVVRGYFAATSAAWCRSVFGYSVFYLTILFSSLILGA